MYAHSSQMLHCTSTIIQAFRYRGHNYQGNICQLLYYGDICETEQFPSDKSQLKTESTGARI